MRGGTSTTTTTSKLPARWFSASSGTSWTTTGAPPACPLQLGHALADPGVDDRVQLQAQRFVGEHQLPQPARSRLPSARSTSGPNSGDHLGQAGGAGGHHLPRQRVGVDDDRAVGRQPPRDLALARADPAGEPDPERPHASQASGPYSGPQGPLRQAAGSALAAGQLVAQGRERLVRGERARRAVLVGGVAGGGGAAAAAGLAGLAVGAAALAVLGLFRPCSRLGDLAAVRLAAGARLGVLALPLLALVVVALEPLAGLRVEALGVDVVALRRRRWRPCRTASGRSRRRPPRRPCPRWPA